jgi:hypothetical protein
MLLRSALTSCAAGSCGPNQRSLGFIVPGAHKKLACFASTIDVNIRIHWLQRVHPFSMDGLGPKYFTAEFPSVFGYCFWINLAPPLLAPFCFHHVSTLGRFFPVLGLAGGSERNPAMIHERVSAGSMTSSISNKVAVLSALPRS